MKLDKDNFDEVLAKNTITIIDFWAEWCGPCRKVSPILDEISSEYNVVIGKLNVDEFPEIASKYNVSSIPNMIVFENGIPVKSIIGAQPKHKLIKEFESWL
jgi:thioredoxin 1